MIPRSPLLLICLLASTSCDQSAHADQKPVIPPAANDVGTRISIAEPPERSPSELEESGQEDIHPTVPIGVIESGKPAVLQTIPAPSSTPVINANEAARDNVVRVLLKEAPSQEVDIVSDWLLKDADPNDPPPSGLKSASTLGVAVDAACALLESCLDVVAKSEQTKDFPNAMINLAEALRFQTVTAKEEMEKNLSRIREVDYRNAVIGLQKLESAMAEGATEIALVRLKKQAQDQISALEDRATSMDRTIAKLDEHERSIRDALRLWKDRELITTSTLAECAILRDNFVALFRRGK